MIDKDDFFNRIPTLVLRYLQDYARNFYKPRHSIVENVKTHGNAKKQTNERRNNPTNHQATNQSNNQTNKDAYLQANAWLRGKYKHTKERKPKKITPTKLAQHHHKVSSLPRFATKKAHLILCWFACVCFKISCSPSSLSHRSANSSVGICSSSGLWRALSTTAAVAMAALAAAAGIAGLQQSPTPQ